MECNQDRRNFLKSGVALAFACINPLQLLNAAAQAATLEPRRPGKDKVLVVVQLAGGNDGLNTVIPYGIGAYYQARPNLAIKQEEVLALNGQIGLHPNMQALAQLYKNNKLAIIQAVGYPEPNRSHFRSIEIWQTAAPDRIADTGWLGRYLDLSSENASAFANILPAVNVDPSLPKTLSANNVIVPSVNNVYNFRFKTDPRYASDRQQQLATFQDIYDDSHLQRPHIDQLCKTGIDAREASDYLLKVVSNYQGKQKYQNNDFGHGMQFIAQMITGGVKANVYYVTLGGFDTHANQARTQGNLLAQLSNVLAAFQADLEDHNVDKDVITMCFSEFGRRVCENGGRGTDHGTAEPCFIMGSAIKGGIYGDHPSLTNLDQGDLKYQIDFRSMYATILDNWLGADSRQILGANFDKLSFA